MSNALTTTGSFSLAPQSLDEAFRFADMLATSDLVPKDFQRKPGNILVAMQWGAEVGLKPLQALQNIAVINGRPALWGDAVMALVRSSPACEYVIEEQKGDTAVCRVKRRGEPEQVRTFSQADATKSGLAGKSGPWSQYPARMRQLRARAFALRDVFADVLKGLPIAEEVADYVDETPRAQRPTQPAVVVQAQQIAAAAAPAECPASLLSAAEDAALRGVGAYQEFWRAASKVDRQMLSAHHDGLKLAAKEADEARTVEAPASDAADADGVIDDEFAAAMGEPA